MNNINIFLANNYMWFLYADIFMVFVLIIYVIIYKLKHRTSKKEVLETIKINDGKVEELEIKPEVIDDTPQETIEVLEGDNQTTNETDVSAEVMNDEPTFKS